MSPLSKRLRIFQLLIVAAILQSCAASNGKLYRATDCITPPAIESDYRIGPGDMLQIVVWRNAELSTLVPVRPDGKISTPLVDDVVASGRTPSELAENMEQVLGEYLRTPDVSVIVTGQGAANQINIVGEVTAPQQLSHRSGLRILDLVVGAGGLTEFAAGNRGKLLRETPDGQIECRVKVRDLMSGDMSQNIEVYPGDVLVIPETRF